MFTRICADLLRMNFRIKVWHRDIVQQRWICNKQASPGYILEIEDEFISDSSVQITRGAIACAVLISKSQIGMAIGNISDRTLKLYDFGSTG